MNTALNRVNVSDYRLGSSGFTEIPVPKAFSMVETCVLIIATQTNSIMPNRTFLTPLVAIILLVYALFSGGPVPTWNGFNRTAGFVGFILLGWDYYLWRLPWLHPKIVPHPNLRGTWRTEGTIYHLPPPSIEGVTASFETVPVLFEKIEGYLIIRQTGSGFKLTALWDNDRYTSIMKRLAPLTGADGRGVFVGEYENRDGITIGVAGIIIKTDSAPKEAKMYYTTIETIPQRGLVVFRNRVRQVCNTLEEANRLPLDSQRSNFQKLKFFLWPW